MICLLRGTQSGYGGELDYDEKLYLPKESGYVGE